MTSTWYGVEDTPAQQRLVAAWQDAPIENLELCGMLLDTAREQVIEYAPAPSISVVDGYITATTDALPSRYVYAQLQQAKNLWNAGRVNGDGQIGGDFTYVPRPLDKTIQSIIRPTNVRPRVY